MKQLFVLSAFCLASLGSLKAQSISDIVLAGLSNSGDMNQYMQAYLRPYAESQMYNASSGWYHSGKTHRKLGFDVTTSFKMAFIPSDKEVFTFRNADYQNLSLSNSNINTASLPTFLGNETTLQLTDKTTNSSFQAPSGISKSFKDVLHISSLAVPLPIVQASVGLWANTNITLRYFPSTRIGKVNVGVFGLGAQHDLGQYIPLFKTIPFIHLSGLAAYNKLTAKYAPNDNFVNSYGSVSNSQLQYTIHSFTVQAIGSAKLAFAELYVGGGYFTGKSTLGYQFQYSNAFTNTQGTYAAPLDIRYQKSGFTATTGMQLHVFFFKLFADYTFAEYRNVNLGFACSFR